MLCKVLGCGSYLPPNIITNNELQKEKNLNTSSEWIETRTGILQRHISSPEELTSDLANKAALAAIYDAQINKFDIDLIIVCTTTPDNTLPSTAAKVQGYLELNTVPSFDLQAVCSGFVYGLHLADSLLQTKKHKTILLIGAEKMSCLLDWTDRSSCILFGDGAGAIILSTNHQSKQSGIVDTAIYSDGKLYNILYTDGGTALNNKSGKLRMHGKEVFKHAVEKMSSSIDNLLKKNNLTQNDIKYLIPHQGNIRIIDNIASKLNIPEKKIVKTIYKHANCSAASIPLALDYLKNNYILNEGDLILIVALGAGLTWGCALIKW